MEKKYPWKKIIQKKAKNWIFLIRKISLQYLEEKIFEKYGEKIIGKYDIWGGYQINIPNKSVDELEKIAEKIKKEDRVVVSRIHRIIATNLDNEIYPNDNFKYKKIILIKKICGKIMIWKMDMRI